MSTRHSCRQSKTATQSSPLRLLGIAALHRRMYKRDVYVFGIKELGRNPNIASLMCKVDSQALTAVLGVLAHGPSLIPSIMPSQRQHS